MNSPAVDIKDFLESSECGVGTFGTDIFIGIMPETPDACICISDASGLKPESRYEWEYPGLQVLVRKAEGNYVTAREKIIQIKDCLHGLNNRTINGTIYKMIVAAHEPLYLGVDGINRPMFSINFELQRTSA